MTPVDCTCAPPRGLDPLGQPVLLLLLGLAPQLGLDQVVEVVVGERVERVLEAGGEHPLDLVLPGLGSASDS